MAAAFRPGAVPEPDSAQPGRRACAAASERRALRPSRVSEGPALRSGPRRGSRSSTRPGPRGAVRATRPRSPSTPRPLRTAAARPALEPHPGSWSRMTGASQRELARGPHFFLQREVDARRAFRWKDACNSRATVAVTPTGRPRGCTGPGRRPSSPRAVAVVAGGTPDAAVRDIRDRRRDRRGPGRARDPLGDTRSIDELARERAGSERARAGQLAPPTSGGGVSPSPTSASVRRRRIPCHPQPARVAAILAVGRVGTALRLASGAPAEYPVLTLTLSCDHRVVDGAVAARFLGELAEALENPLVLLD